MGKINSINNKSGVIEIDPGISGDSYVQFSINGTGEFKVGVDDDASDTFKISQGSALGANDTFVMSSSGELTLPLQPSFFNTSSTYYLNVTGDGTYYSIIYASSYFDQSSDFDDVSTFTAPTTGTYLIGAGLGNYIDLSGGNEQRISLVTSNRTYQGGFLPTRVRIANFAGANNYTGLQIYVLADMDASDTAYAQFMSANGSKLDDTINNLCTNIFAVLVC